MSKFRAGVFFGAEIDEFYEDAKVNQYALSLVPVPLMR
mgnify:CR=1 FL=1